MKMYRTLVMFAAILFLVSCKSAIYKVAYPALSDGRYDSEFPYKSSSDQLEEITNSVKMLNSVAYYTAYVFDYESMIRKKDINQKVLDEKNIDIGRFDRTASGTATIVSSQFGSVVLLTCAHIVDFPDTIISYFKTPSGYNTGYIESISIKDKQVNYIPEFPSGGEVDVLVRDDKLDLALLGRHFGKDHIGKFDVFNYPIGKAKELNWGSFVYAIGFPMNYKMLSKGIVSSPNKDKRGSFLIDAVFNKGFSGGVVLAIRDGVPNFELVGLVNTVPIMRQFVLTPKNPSRRRVYNPIVPYKGEAYLQEMMNIRYGVTKVISVETIIDFIQNNWKTVLTKGYNMKDLYDKITIK